MQILNVIKHLAPDRNRLLKFIMLLSAISMLIATCFIFGYYVAKKEISPLSDIILRVERKIGKLRGAPSETETLVSRIETTFVQLTGQVIKVPIKREGNGGGLTQWDKELLLLTYEGDVFSINQNAQLSATNITPPDNGYSDYVQASHSEKYAGFNHNFSFFRYNDIKFVDNGAFKRLFISTHFYDRSRECYGNRIYASNVPVDIVTTANLVIKSTDWNIIYDSEPCLPLKKNRIAIEGNISGGRMTFAAPNSLYIGNGDFNLEGIYNPVDASNLPNSHYGKIIKINLDNNMHEIISLGHRNPQGIATDKSGNIWVAEHGFRGGDELNLIKKGRHYGWPHVSLGTLYDMQPFPGIKTQGRHDGYEKPVFSWLPSAGISSLMVIDGFDESWDGDLLAGSLSSPDYGQRLFRIRIENDKVMFVENIRLGRRIRSLSSFGKNKIAVWLDTHELVIFSKAPRPNRFQQIQKFAAAEFGDEFATRLMGAIQECSQCHSFEQQVHNVGPSLSGILNRQVASTSFQGYSEALKSYGGNWTPERLKAYIRNPKKNVIGTIMPETGLQDDKLIEGIIWVFKKMKVLEDTHYRYDQANR